MKQFPFILILLALAMGLEAKTLANSKQDYPTSVKSFPQNGTDSTSAEFFQTWYKTGELSHYLDNYSEYVCYEMETTGEWGKGEQMVFSIAGNSFRQSKYLLNDFRIDSRFAVGHSFVFVNMFEHSLITDYQQGMLNFRTLDTQPTLVRLSANIGGLGGISPGASKLINLFHSSSEQRAMDNRPIDMRNHIVGAGTMEITYRNWHAYADYGYKQNTAFDETGICELSPHQYYKAQVDGAIPVNKLDALNYIVSASGRTDLFSEFLYNDNELARQETYMAAIYGSKAFRNEKLTMGVSWALNNVHHSELDFTRNILDQDGEAFEPWYADGITNEANLSIAYQNQFLPWLNFRYDAYNSFVHFSPSTASWHNNLIFKQMDMSSAIPLYRYEWASQAFSTGLLENSLTLNAEKDFGIISIFGQAGMSLDGILLSSKSVVSPNWLAKIGLDIHPCNWFRLGLTLSQNRMSYTMDEARFLSDDYLNADIYYAETNNLLATTGGKYHHIEKNLWSKQPSYVMLDLPVRFAFGKNRRHTVDVLSSIRKYYNQWFTTFADGVENNGFYDEQGIFFLNSGGKNYTIGVQSKNIMSDKWIQATPYYMSNIIKYAYSGRKVFVSLSWQSYLMAGMSSLGNGVLHNNIGVLSESTANPNTFTLSRKPEMEFKNHQRMDQDRAYIMHLLVTYNICDYVSVSLNGKFVDGQPFTNFNTKLYNESLNSYQVAIYNEDAKGINMTNNYMGKREDAFFNFDLRVTGRWWIKGIPFEAEALCYNLYDFGTSLTEYTFDNCEHPTYYHWTEELGRSNMSGSRTPMSLCIPRGLIISLKIGLEKEQR